MWPDSDKDEGPLSNTEDIETAVFQLAERNQAALVAAGSRGKLRRLQMAMARQKDRKAQKQQHI